ncbi:MAG: hypothetical protein RL060_55, partial [Bacteroidota bacterium]
VSFSLFFLLGVHLSKAQTTIWSENFEGCTNNAAIESASCGWATYAITSSAHNYFAATNSATDSYRINANKNLTVFGDPAGSSDDYHYDKWVNANEVAYFATKVNATSYTALKLNYKWKSLGDGTTADYGAICYSTNGTTWTDLSANLYNQSATQTVSNFDISSLNATQFYIGVRWVNDDITDGMPPITVDDMSITGTVALPIQLIGFNALLSEETVILSWKTISEKDNKLFSIERSSDGVNFTSIGFINGYTSSNSLKSYTYSDNITALKNHHVLYYRLKQTDEDDNFVYSDLKTVLINPDIDNEDENKISILPNPAPLNTEIAVKLNGFEASQNITLVIENTMGEQVFTNTETTNTAGAVDFFVPTTLPSGVYFLVFGDTFLIKKLVIK